MVVDPSIENLLDLISAYVPEDFSIISVQELRKLMDENPLPKKIEEVHSVKDMTFQHHGRSLKLRLYDPTGHPDSLVIYFHGGGFVFGSVESYDPVCRKVANASRCKVISVDYSLAPEHKFPAALDDAYESYLWITSAAKELGIDPGNIALMGDSAGGNLVAGTCLRLKDSGIQLPKLQVMFYPALGPDFFSGSLREYSDGYFLTRKHIEFFGSAYLSSPSDAMDPYFAPILHPDLSGLPEALIITAEHDPLRDQGEMYLTKLYKSGTQATGITAKGMIHGFVSFFSISPAAENIITMVCGMVGVKLKQ